MYSKYSELVATSPLTRNRELHFHFLFNQNYTHICTAVASGMSLYRVMECSKKKKTGWRHSLHIGKHTMCGIILKFGNLNLLSEFDMSWKMVKETKITYSTKIHLVGSTLLLKATDWQIFFVTKPFQSMVGESSGYYFLWEVLINLFFEANCVDEAAQSTAGFTTTVLTTSLKSPWRN